MISKLFLFALGFYILFLFYTTTEISSYEASSSEMISNYLEVQKEQGEPKHEAPASKKFVSPKSATLD